MIQVTRIGHATFETPDLDRQIDYFTNIVGLVLAERVDGRAFLATKVGDLAVQLEKASTPRCARIALQAAALDKLKKFEFNLRKKADGADQPLSLSGSDEVPAGFRTAIEEYYRALAKK